MGEVCSADEGIYCFLIVVVLILTNCGEMSLYLPTSYSLLSITNISADEVKKRELRSMVIRRPLKIFSTTRINDRSMKHK